MASYGHELTFSFLGIKPFQPSILPKAILLTELFWEESAGSTALN
ncbi:MAG: hypothetical protein ACR2MD_03890 [Aridibacter sp.]